MASNEESDGVYLNIPTPSTNMINFAISTAWTLLFFYAIFLVFKCNKGTFNIGHFLAAFFFAPFYVIYQLANNFEGCSSD
tara:strand:- start:8558 stop:8797 length:240 start_codon:yes stop_codon:yes gene_type:complete